MAIVVMPPKHGPCGPIRIIMPIRTSSVEHQTMKYIIEYTEVDRLAESRFLLRNISGQLAGAVSLATRKIFLTIIFVNILSKQQIFLY